MRKPTLQQTAQFLLFAFPCFWTLALTAIALCVWKVGFDEPDLLPLALISCAVTAAAVLLSKGFYPIAAVMAAVGIFIFFQNDQHMGGVFRLFGAYLVLHYLACGAHVYKQSKKRDR